MARRPSPGNLSDPYGWRTHPIWGDRRFHGGLDIGWSAGRTLVAPADGVIIAYGWQGGWGKRLDFRSDDGVVHYLAHTADLWVPVNSRVAEGSPIAEMGATGDVTGVHLHWETRPGGGATIDPEEWLRGAAPASAGSSSATTLSEEDDMATLVTGGGQNLIVGGKLIPLAGAAEVQAVKGAQVLEVAPSTHYNIIQAFARDQVNAGLPVLVYVRDGDGTVYTLTEGKLRALVDPTTLAELHAKGAASVTLSQAEVTNLLGS